LGGGLVALVLLLAALLLCLEALSLVLVWTVLGYPALCLVAPFCAYPVEWGPIVRLLLWMLRIVLGRHLRLAVAVLLQKRIEVLVLLVRRGQMRARALPLLLGALQTVVLLQLLLCKPRVTLPDRLASSHAVLAGLLCGFLLPVVPREPRCDAAAEGLLRLVDVCRRRLWLLWLLRAAAVLVVGGRQLWWAGLRLLLLLVALRVQMRTQTVLRRGTRWVLLAVLALRRRLLAWWHDLLAFRDLVLLPGLVVYRQRCP
jgi:hypothetical protein